MSAGVLLVEHSTGDVVAVRFTSATEADRWLAEHPEVEDISWRPLLTRRQVLADSAPQSGDPCTGAIGLGAA